MTIALLLAALMTAAPPVSLGTARNDGRVLTIQDGSAADPLPITTTDEALAILADRRFEALWPDVLQWAGADLTGLRDRRVEAARAVFAKGKTREAKTGPASTVSPRARAVFVLIDALWDAGQREEARALAEQARGTAPARGHWGPHEWVAFSLRLAQMRGAEGDLPGALAIIDAAAVPLGDGRETLNLRINRASLLAQVGRADEALAALDIARAQYDAPGLDGPFVGTARVRGSDRQFAWVRVCALTKLGKVEEAAAAAAPLTPAAEPVDKRFVIEPTVRLRQSLAGCVQDAPMLARAYAEELRAGRLDGTTLLELQPAFRHPILDPGFMAAVRANPALAPILAEQMRVLPPELVPALNGWQSSPPRN